MIDLTEVADRWGDDHFKDFLHFNDAASDEWAALVAPRVAADSDIRRLHASHIGRTSMPTRVLQAAIVTDRPPEPLPAARDISVSLISPGVRGFGFVEGPYPQWTMPRPVRWLEGKHGEIRFTGGGGKSFILRMNVRSIAPDQKIEDTPLPPLGPEALLRHGWQLPLTCPGVEAGIQQPPRQHAPQRPRQPAQKLVEPPPPEDEARHTRGHPLGERRQALRRQLLPPEEELVVEVDLHRTDVGARAAQAARRRAG